jgi:hypothetical protein
MVLRHPAPISIYIFAAILISFPIPTIVPAVIWLPFNKKSLRHPALIPLIDSGRYPAPIPNNVPYVFRFSFLRVTYIFAVILILFPTIITDVIRLPFNKHSCRHPALIPLIDSGRYPALIPSYVPSVILLSFLTFISAVIRLSFRTNIPSVISKATHSKHKLPAVMRAFPSEQIFLLASGHIPYK